MFVVLYRVVALSSQYEVGRYQLCSLVKELEERVLSVGGWFAKHYSASCIFDVIA